MDQNNRKPAGAGLVIKNFLIFAAVALASLVLVELLKLKVLPVLFH